MSEMTQAPARIEEAFQRLLDTSFSLASSVRRFAVHHRKLTCFLIALIPILVRLSLLPYLPIPDPALHDDFAFLLGADTFVLGRLANPPHPMWKHFETINVNQQPTYATKEPPAQCFFLAFGQKVFGHPWYGLVFSVGLMCGCICWMLQGWLPPTYAALGSLFAIAQYSTHGWVDSYQGGAVGAAGGALVLGALPRLVQRPTLSASLLGAIGAAILANSRYYEGLILVLASAASIWWWRRQEKRPLKDLFARHILIPGVIVLSCTFAWMAYYNYRVTGKPWLLPYVVNNRTYATSPFFWLLPQGPAPAYRHEIVRKLWETEHDLYLKARAQPALLIESLRAVYLQSFLSSLSALPLIASLGLLSRGCKVRVALAILCVFAFGLLMEKAVQGQYLAPAASLIFFLAVVGWRHLLRVARSTSRVGRTLVLPVCIIVFVLSEPALEAARTIRYSSGVRLTIEDFPAERREVIEQLMRLGRRHVVIVRYAPTHNPHFDWVRNRANIDDSEIVWAQDMGDSENVELLGYYGDRKAWLFEPDKIPMTPKPYPVGSSRG